MPNIFDVATEVAKQAAIADWHKLAAMARRVAKQHPYCDPDERRHVLQFAREWGIITEEEEQL